MKSRILLIVIIILLAFLSYDFLAKNKPNNNNDCRMDPTFNCKKSDNQETELYNEIIHLINLDKKKDNVNIDMNNQLDSSLICFDKIKKYIEGRVIKIFYHDRENVYFNLEKLNKYLEENNYQAIGYCMADGPDGTEQAFLKNKVMLLLTGQWDGGDDSDTTYVPSKYFEFYFYLMKMNQADSVIISSINR